MDEYLIAFLLFLEVQIRRLYRILHIIVEEIKDMFIYIFMALIFMYRENKRKREEELQARIEADVVHDRYLAAKARTANYTNSILAMSYSEFNDLIHREIIELAAQYCFINRPYMDKGVFILDTNYYTELRVYITGIVLSNLYPLKEELEILHFPGVVDYVFTKQYDIARIGKISAIITETLKTVKEAQ